MRKILKDCLTGTDNKTFDFIRVFTGFTLIVYFALWFLSVNEPWVPLQFAEGFALILISAGASIRIKGTVEGST